MRAYARTRQKRWGPWGTRVETGKPQPGRLFLCRVLVQNASVDGEKTAGSRSWTYSPRHARLMSYGLREYPGSSPAAA
jgi:hypothetical protein